MVSEPSLINLLVVDRSLSDIDHIVQILRASGYVVQEMHSDQEAEIHNCIQYKPVDLIMVREGENLPKLQEVHAQVIASGQDIPILAIMDEQLQQKPVKLLRAGADNFFYLGEPEHLALAVRKELSHLRIRQQLHSQEARIKESEARCRALLENSRDAIAYIHEGAHTYANPAYLQLFGYANEQELEGITLMNLVSQDDRDKLKTFLRQSIKAGRSVEPIELTGLDKKGNQFPASVECIPTRMNEEPCLQIRIHNPSQRQQAEQKLDEFSKLDGLTGLYNRKFFTQYLDQICAATGSGSGAVLYILLTNYRSVNEQVGLEAVDQLAIDLANLLRSLVSENEIIARFSDAVFTLYTAESSGRATLQLGERICEAMKSHVTHAAHKLISTTFAIGICMVQKNHENAMQVLSHADRACEIARQMGGNQVQIYTPPTGIPGAGESRQEEKLVALIRDAMSGERLRLLFQPIASFQGDLTERYKVYLHVLGKDNKLLPMSTLGPVAESRGLMLPLDRWAVVRGLQTISERYQLLGKPTTLFIRISQNSVAENGFHEWLEKHIKDIGPGGGILVVEVTEQCAERCFKETKQLREHLQQLGCGFALAHFGGRPNSERILNHLLPDYLKLEGSLIEKFAKGRDAEGRRAMAALTQQAQGKNILVVAADIATAPQMASIWQFGVTLVQGDMVQEPGEQMDFDFKQFAG